MKTILIFLLAAFLGACSFPTPTVAPSATQEATSTPTGTSTQIASGTPFFDATGTFTAAPPTEAPILPSLTPTATSTVRTATPLPEGPVVLQTYGHGLTTTALLYPDTWVTDANVLSVRSASGIGWPVVDRLLLGERFGGWIVAPSPGGTVWVNVITRRGIIGAVSSAFAHLTYCNLTVGVLAQNDVARIVDTSGYATDSFLSEGETEFFVSTPVTITLLSPVNGAEISGSLYLPLECKHSYASVRYGP